MSQIHANGDNDNISSPITKASNETLARNNFVPPSNSNNSNSNNNNGGIVQAAGHGLLRLDPDRDGAILKPTTRQECVTYECLIHDERVKRFLPFIPRYFASWPMQFVVPGSKFTHEVSLENLCLLDDERHVFRWDAVLEVDVNTTSTSEGGSNNAGYSLSRPRVVWESSSNSAPVPAPPPSKFKLGSQLYQSPPCVLDLKIGRFRHTKATPLRKYMRQMRKDSATTARSVGMRVCGVKHCRVVVDSLIPDDVLYSMMMDGEEGGSDNNSNNSIAAKRAMRAAQRRKNKEKAYKANDSDSEIMQLPKAMEQAESQRRRQMQQQENDEQQKQQQKSSVEPEVLQWNEDKIFGRNSTPEELLEVLGMFSTLYVDSDDAVGRPQLCPEDRSAPLRFDPFPVQALLVCFKDKVRAMTDVIDSERILERYSFASASVLFVHRFRFTEVRTTLDDDKKKDGDSGSNGSNGNKKSRSAFFHVHVDADLRLVDFSSSGPIDLSVASLGTEFNAALRDGDAASIAAAAARKAAAAAAQQHDQLPHPAAAPNMVFAVVPEKGVVPLFDDEIIEFRFGLDNLNAALEQLCCVGQRMIGE